MKKFNFLFATLFAATALYAGDILEICPCDEFGNTVSLTQYTLDNPAHSGVPLYFNIRLISEEKNNPPAVAAADRSKFVLTYIAEGGMGEVTDATLNPLKIGIVVSGKTKWARLINVQRTPASASLSPMPECAYNLTDCIFEYDTEPGDMALPLRLAQDDKGTPCGLIGSGAAPIFQNQNKWCIYYYEQKATVATRAAEYLMISAERYTSCIQDEAWLKGLSDSDKALVPQLYNDGIRLYRAGLWVQTLDIDGRTDEDAWENYPDYWKSAAKGHTASSTVRSNGDAVLTNLTEAWVWAVDKDWLDKVKVNSTEEWVEPKVEMAGSNSELIEVTVGYDRNTSKPVTQWVRASRVEIPGGAYKGDFTFKALADSGDAYLVMSGSADFLWKKETGYEFVKDSFQTVPVRCVKSEPELTLKRTESAKSYTVTSDYESALTKLALTLSDDYTETITVTITPRLTKPGDPVKYAWTDYIHLSAEDGDYERLDPLEIKFTDGKAATKTVFVFGMGAAGEDTGLYYDKDGNRIEFDLTVEPEAAKTFLEGRITADNIFVKPADPVVANAAALAEVSVRGGVALPIDIAVSDNYTDMNDTTTGYKVKFLAPGATEADIEELKTKDGAAALWKPKANGILYAYDAATGTYTADRPAIPNSVATGDAKMWLVAPNEATSAVVAMHLTVTDPAQVSAAAYETEDGTVQTKQFKEFDATTGEATAVYVEVSLSEAYEKSDALYAFLKLSDDTQLKYVEGDCLVGSDFSAGIPIYRTYTTSDGRGVIYLKDGVKKGTTLKFSIVLCTTDEYDETKVVTDYKSNDITIKVSNVNPVVNNIRMNGWGLNADKTAFRGNATVNIEQTFKFDVWDAELDLDATGTEAFKLAYSFEDGSNMTAEQEVTGNPSTWAVTHKFVTEGKGALHYTITDKDGGKVTGSVAVTVSANPYVLIEGDVTVFQEGTFPSFTLSLSEAADADLTVRLTVTALSTGDKRGKIEISGGTYVSEGVYDFTFKAGSRQQTFSVKDSDGTAGGASVFEFSAAVTTTSIKPGTADTKWCDFYSPAQLAPITVNNELPRLTIDGKVCIGDTELNSSNSPISVAIGEADEIVWSVDDVKADLDVGIKVTIVDQYGSHKQTVCDTADQTFTPQFKYAGTATVTFTATDKDGGSITATRYYLVKSTRQLNITAVGPSDNGNGSTHANYYRSAGRGQGHVWANAKCTSAANFSFDFNCGLANFVKASAQGYRVGDIDDGSLTKNGSLGDNAITPDGKLWTSGNYFTYDSEYDSFFYCWVKDAYDNGVMTSAIFGGVAPEVKTASTTSIDLPTEKDDEDAYAQTTFEAIFSREWLKTDNIGDINNDAIPDIYALGYEGFGVSGDDMTDMTSLTTYNNDGDYLPWALDKVQSSFIFMPTNAWAENSKKFTAKLEIRGYGDHLNDAWSVLNKQGYAGKVPEYSATKTPTDTFTELEYDAWLQAGSPEDWSPERPSDPTNSDTDGDTMPDGYEYYIWYKAHVGWMENGVHKYLTGRKYNPGNPYDPIEITSATLASIYDPISYNGDFSTRDTDDDGLTDYAEMVLGTNPFDYDTDGDGLPDGYEVAFTNTDPCDSDTNDNNISDGAENDDNDAMADYTTGMLYVAVLGANNKVERYCCAATNAFTVSVATNAPATGVVFRVLSGGGATTNRYLTSKAWQTYKDADGKERLTVGYTKSNTWICKTDDDGYLYRGDPVALDVGTLVDSVDEKAEYYNRTVQGSSSADWYEAFPYTSATGYARGKKAAYTSVAGKPVIANGTEDIHWIHYAVYEGRGHAAGYDPRTGWMYPPEAAIDSSSYTHMDEFLSMVFFHKMGTITEEQMTVSLPNRTRVKIWTDYSTHPLNADTDNDKMPDGWELYLMAGVQAAAGPTTIYSPLYQFSKIPSSPNTLRDPDLDMLQWPEEYSGTSSSARYGWSPSQANWRNKSMPTDPWNDDTDSDGLKDGYEGGNGDNYYAGIIGSYFFYNTSGRAGGGLNPLSWDTDGDHLPDPWEAEFHGTYNATASGVINTAIQGSTNTTSLVVGNRCTWNMDGMDGTVGDARLDYDGDGLANWQEYMTGTMRCWRYDDIWDTWGVQTATGDKLPDPGTDEWNQYWYDRLVDTMNVNGNYNPHLANGYFDPGMYMSRCTKAWDGNAYNSYYYFKDGVDHNLTSIGLDNPAIYTILMSGDAATYIYSEAPNHYICTDPRVVDSDGDGMDDYYELFHGLNPLLGLAGQTKSVLTTGGPFNAYDIVHDAYARPVNKTMGGASGAGPTALNNWWCNDVMPHRAADIKHKEIGGYDFIAHPWLNGIAGADPDGDNIVNIEEAIMPKVQAASTYHHTDPTSLWVTDSAYTNSLTRKYFRNMEPDGEESTSVLVFDEDRGERTFKDPVSGEEYNLDDFPGFTYDNETGLVTFEYDNNPFSVANGWIWNFEENEGFDSDHDYLSDYEEAQGKTKNASDPQNHDDPVRRQAMYFNGTDAFLQMPVAEEEETVAMRANSEARQNFLYYTVECWAKADKESLANDNQLRTLVERAIWADNSNAADETLMRKNFQIGVKNGRWYTCFDSSGTDKQPVEITDGPVATTNWTHVAATYDGTSLRLYVNGVCNNNKATSIQPEHGVAALAINHAGEMNPTGHSTYFTTYCISILVGASADTLEGLIFDSAWRFKSYQYVDEVTNPDGLYTNATTLADYGNFYKGYVDEVRIWDGARSAADILSDYENRTRYTLALAAENREAVYNAWKQGGLRSPASDIQLPAELMYHLAFDHIAGAVLPEDVIKVPAGFDTAKSVLNAKARWSRPADYVEKCWASTAVKSTVYTDNAWVPWINNTVSHLPRFDLTALDSVYWSEDYAGYKAAADYGYTSFDFPRTAEVYSRRKQQTYSATEYYDSHRDPYFDYWNGYTTTYQYLTAAIQDRDTRWHAVIGYDSTYTNDETLAMFRFASRNRNISGDDFLPMGGAYPRRISLAEGGLWDNQPGQSPSASDAWAQTGNDADNNGLPDWWEEYARANYCQGLDPKTPLEWGTTVTYYGVQMPAYEAYLRDLAKGLVKIGSTIKYDDNYADTRDMDGDNIPDWWEQLYGVDTGSAADAKADPDLDNLSSVIEYLVSSMSDFPSIRANRYATFADEGQLVSDYFLRHGSLYLGEMFTDHDFIEDWWEDEQPTELTGGGIRVANYSRYVYDANRDSDNDGWNNWEEARATIDGGWTNVITVVADDAGVAVTNTEVLSLYELAGGRPIPEVPIAITCNGLHSSLQGQAVVVKAWCQENVYDPVMHREPDATWVFTADDTNPLTMTTNLTTATKGYLRSGKNMFIAYVAPASTTGTSTTTVPAFVPGQPYGVATGVEVNYLKAAPFTIELTEVNASMLRINLLEAVEAQRTSAAANFSSYAGEKDLKDIRTKLAVWHDNPTNELDEPCLQYLVAVSNTFQAAASHTDRGTKRHPYATLTCPMSIGTNIAFVASNVHVRVFRTWINGQSAISYGNTKQPYYYSSDDPIFDGWVNLNTHPIITEADMLSAGILDLDWGTLSDVYCGSGEAMSTLESAAYRIVIGDGTASVLTNNNLLAVMMLNHFEKGRYPTTASNLTATSYGSQPTFTWTHKNTIDKLYPAFRLKVTDGATVLYDSGAMPAPARDSYGRYTFTAPVWPGMMTASGVAVQADKDYTWKVSMLDAKFSEFPANAASGTFRIRGSNILNDYGTVSVVVKYMGPGNVATNGVTNLICVAAYTAPDFSGMPYGVGYVSRIYGEEGENMLSSPDCLDVNARIEGLLKNQDYYLRAFLDTNGNGERDEWESWGYANYVGTESNNIYSARAISIVEGKFTLPCEIYVEDVDTNNNQLPDVWEWNKDGGLGGTCTKGIGATSPYVVMIGEDGVAATNILWAAEQSGASQLPYYAMLAQVGGNGRLTASSLALAVAGIDLEEIETDPSVIITSFSLEDGITLAVDPGATTDGDVLVPKAVTIEVSLTLQLQQASSLGGSWADVGEPVTKSFTVSGTTTVRDGEINEAIRTAVEENAGEGFFRVNVSVGSKLVD